jgi:hypothetical protein
VLNSVSENEKLRRQLAVLQHKNKALEETNKEKVGDEKKLKMSL